MGKVAAHLSRGLRAQIRPSASSTGTARCPAPRARRTARRTCQIRKVVTTLGGWSPNEEGPQRGRIGSGGSLPNDEGVRTSLAATAASGARARPSVATCTGWAMSRAPGAAPRGPPNRSSSTCSARCARDREEIGARSRWANMVGARGEIAARSPVGVAEYGDVLDAVGRALGDAEQRSVEGAHVPHLHLGVHRRRVAEEVRPLPSAAPTARAAHLGAPDEEAMQRAWGEGGRGAPRGCASRFISRCISAHISA